MSDLSWRTSNGASGITSRRISVALAVAAAAGWFWALSLLATREHLPLTYDINASAPAAWGFLALPLTKLALFLSMGAVLAAGCARHGQVLRSACSRPTGWLLAAYLIPALDLLRLCDVAVPVTFLEPLWLSFVTGIAVAAIVRAIPWNDRLAEVVQRRYWLVAVWLLTAGAAVWWYLQGEGAYEDYMLGYHDFGHFARRVVNTWEGRGFLRETPSRPAFWDHFNPGLGLLSPLWGVWSDARLFILLQATCLAGAAPLVFGIARAWGAGSAAAAAWAATYLAFPVVGQLNLNYSYGWHPVSLALPLIFAAVWLLLHRYRLWAAVVAVLACSFKETVFVTLACLAAALAFQTWWTRGRDSSVADPAPSDDLLASRLPLWGWATVWAVLSIAFVLVFKLTAFSEFQTNRFSELGNSTVAILLSPALRPSVFWEQVLRHESLLFVLLLLVPLGLTMVVRGWPILLAIVLPIGVLLAWNHGAATSIAFQYTTTLIPVLVIAAIAGAARMVREDRRKAIPNVSQTPPTLLVTGLSALAAALTASTCLGSLPWSSATMGNMVARSYEWGDDLSDNPRAEGSEGNAAANEIVAMVDGKDAAVLASSRIAAHLLGVRRLETVEQAGIFRWDALCKEAGEGRSGVEVFDWIVLDTYERFQQSEDRIQFFIREAERAGFRRDERSRQGILVLAKGDVSR